MAPDYKLRLATEDDVSAIDELITRSVHGLQAKDYSQEQRDAALGQVFLTDRGLIADRTYFVVETKAGDLVGAGAGPTGEHSMAATPTVMAANGLTLPWTPPASVPISSIRPSPVRA